MKAGHVCCWMAITLSFPLGQRNKKKSSFTHILVHTHTRPACYYKWKKISSCWAPRSGLKVIFSLKEPQHFEKIVNFFFFFKFPSHYFTDTFQCTHMWPLVIFARKVENSDFFLKISGTRSNDRCNRRFSSDKSVHLFFLSLFSFVVPLALPPF